MQPYWTIEELCAGLARRPESWAAVRDGQSFVPLLAFLEHPYSVIDAQFVEGLVAAGLPRNEVEHVSLRDLLIFALTGPLKWAGALTRCLGSKRVFRLMTRLPQRWNESQRTNAFFSAYGIGPFRLPRDGAVSIPQSCLQHVECARHHGTWPQHPAAELPHGRQCRWHCYPRTSFGCGSR
jgi:hypothetical protein